MESTFTDQASSLPPSGTNTILWTITNCIPLRPESRWDGWMMTKLLNCIYIDNSIYIYLLYLNFLFFFQFLLRQAFADDEASTRLLQVLLFLLLSTASLMFIPCSLSIHFFGCLPLLLVPSTCPYSATTGSLFPSILVLSC